MRFFSDLVPRHILAVSILTLMAACGGGGSGSTPAPPDQGGGGTPPPPVTPDFGEVDAAFQSFIDESLVFDGISYVVVDAGGTVHTGTFGDHTEDTVVPLISTGWIPRSPCVWLSPMTRWCYLTDKRSSLMPIRW